MRWGDLRYLILLALFPVLVLFLILTARSYRKKLLQFCEAGFLNRLIPFQSQVRPLIKRVLYGLTFLFFVLTLIEPKWGYHFEDVVRKGVDLMLIVDVSNSMMAEDMKPNRLEREKRKIVDLLKMAQGDRIGLIVFAGKPILLCPLTLDYQTIDQFLEDLSTDLIPIQGTDLKGAIDLAIKSFKDEKSQKALMIFSDGEDFGEDLAQATGKLKELKIPAYIMGFGTPEGAPIPSGRGEGGFKRDDSGNLVVSKLNERALSDLALATGGEYVRSVTNDDDLNELYTKALKGAQQGNEIKTSKKRVYESRFQWPLGIALFLIILEFLISENRRKQKLVSLSIFLFVVVSFHSNAAFAGPLSFLDHYRGWKAYQDQQYPQAQNYFEKALVDNPKDQQMAYNLGNSYYRNGDYLKAAEAFQKAIEGPDIPLREKAFYNLGNSNFKGGQWERAVEAYENALKLDSKDEEAKLNLEFVKKKIQEKQQNQQNQQNQNQDQKSQGQQDQQQGQGGQDSQKSQDQKSENSQDSNSQNQKDQKQDSQKQDSKSQDQKDSQNSKDQQDPNQKSQNQNQDSKSQDQDPKQSENKSSDSQQQNSAQKQNQDSQKSDSKDEKQSSQNDSQNQDGNSKSQQAQKNPKDSSQDSQNNSEPKAAPEGKIEPQNQTGQNQPSNKKQPPSPSAGSQMTTQEADQWLGALDEEAGKILKDQISKKLGRVRRLEKDW